MTTSAILGVRGRFDDEVLRIDITPENRDSFRKEELRGISSTALEAIRVMGQIPGLNPRFTSEKGLNAAWTTFELRPKVKNTEFLQALAKLTGGSAFDSVRTIADQISMSTVKENKGEYGKLSFGDAMKLRGNIRNVKKNATEICALLNANGIDTSGFKGFGKHVG